MLTIELSPVVLCLQLKADDVITDFRPPIDLQCIQYCGKIKGSWSTQTEREQAELLIQL